MQAVAFHDAGPVVTGPRVELQVLTTLKCNLRCTYCSLGVGEVLGSQSKARYTAEQLGDFIDHQLAGKEVYFTLYGGEPTLNVGFAVELMERFPNCRFNLQTNGTLLHRVPDHVLARLSNVMVSIDGGERVTDAYRGRGVYRKVMDNVERTRARMSGTVTARMTWWSGDTTFEEIDGLASSFDYVYFQFAQDPAANAADAVQRKKAVLTQLIEKFFASRALYCIVPIMGTVRNKVVPSRWQELTAGKTQCRVSTNLLNIMPDGKIFPCPDMMYEGELLQGDVIANWLRASPLQLSDAMPCRHCSAAGYCSGNCMKNLYLAYVKNDMQWREAVTEPICELIRFIGEEVDRRDPESWFAAAPAAVRDRLTNAEVYEFCEVMP